MNFSSIFLNRRVRKALAHAYWVNMGCVFQTPMQSAPQVRQQLDAKHIMKDEGDILVTEAGFVTMAIFPNCARRKGDMITVPGVDNNGRRGHLVLRPQLPPFHSLCLDRDEAFADALNCTQKAEALQREFGGKAGLYQAAQRVPWYWRATARDIAHSGLCWWGSESFLSRMGLLSIARLVGMPSVILKFAGPYGIRLRAAVWHRHQQAELCQEREEKGIHAG